MLPKMPQQRNLPQRPSCQDGLIKDPGDTLDSDEFSGIAVLNLDDETVCALAERSDEAPAGGEVE